MNSIPPASESGPNAGNGTAQPTIVIQQPPPGAKQKWLFRLLLIALLFSLFANLSMCVQYRQYFAEDAPPYERYHSGERDAEGKVALLEVKGTIMPPNTGQIITTIKRAREDDDVQGAILVIDSPGGLVADSHQIYHELQKLREKKPVVVVMQRMAASGGYYVAMGAGPKGTIFAEPTTWTGSIGVIIPRYNLRILAEDKLGVHVEPLKSGPFKDSLSPFRDMRADEYAIWYEMIHDSFDRFLNVIADNRPKLKRGDHRLLGWNAPMTLVLNRKSNQKPETAVEHYATGRVFTAPQALQAGLVDKIGFLEDAVEELKERLGEDRLRVVRYKYPLGLFHMLSGMSESRQPERHWGTLRNLAVPQPMYYCTGLPLIPYVPPSAE